MPAMGRPAASAGIPRQYDSWVTDNLAEISGAITRFLAEPPKLEDAGGNVR